MNGCQMQRAARRTHYWTNWRRYKRNTHSCVAMIPTWLNNKKQRRHWEAHRNNRPSGVFAAMSQVVRLVHYPHVPIGKVWIYSLLFVCVFVCVFVWIRISPPTTKLAVSHFAQRFIGIQSRESHIFMTFAPPELRPEAHSRTNRPACGPRPPSCKHYRKVLRSVYLSVCLSVNSHISKNTSPSFTKPFVHVTYGCGSVLLWRQCNTFRFCGWRHVFM